jgi:hypothetical protein
LREIVEQQLAGRQSSALDCEGSPVFTSLRHASGAQACLLPSR